MSNTCRSRTGGRRTTPADSPPTKGTQSGIWLQVCPRFERVGTIPSRGGFIEPTDLDALQATWTPTIWCGGISEGLPGDRLATKGNAITGGGSRSRRPSPWSTPEALKAGRMLPGNNS